MLQHEWMLVEGNRGRWYIVNDRGDLVNWGVNFKTAIDWAIRWYNYQLDVNAPAAIDTPI